LKTIFKMTKQAILFLLLALCITCDKNNEENNTLIFQKLFVNSKENPSTIESKQPLFSWIVEAEGYNKSQSSYHILVASSEDKLNENDADVWNSNKVESDKSTFVKYQGNPLEAFQSYFWKVKISDNQDVVSDWSETQKFEMGLIDEANWGDSKWITLNKDTRTSEHRFRDYKTGRMKEPLVVDGFAASYFRNEIDITKKIKNAQAYICGLGY